MIDVIRIVVFVILPEIHLPEQAAFDEQRQGAIDRGAGDRGIELARHDEQILGGVVLGGRKSGLDNRVPLRSLTQAFLGEKFVNALVYAGLHLSTG